MAQQDFAKLASQGRAFDAHRAWTESELEAVLLLEKEAGEIKDVDGVPTRAGLARTVAAEYVRNGITTVEAYDKSVEVGFEVKSLEEVRDEAVAARQAEVRKQLGLDDESDESDEDSDDDSQKDETDEEKADREKKEAELARLLALTREELEAEATALGVTFTARSKNETIAGNIMEATNKQ